MKSVLFFFCVIILMQECHRDSLQHVQTANCKATGHSHSYDIQAKEVRGPYLSCKLLSLSKLGWGSPVAHPHSTWLSFQSQHCFTVDALSYSRTPSDGQTDSTLCSWYSSTFELLQKSLFIPSLMLIGLIKKASAVGNLVTSKD